MSRKQVVSLTSTILVVTLITLFALWIQNAEANPVKIYIQNVTHSCVDTDHPSQSDICQTVNYLRILIPYPHGHSKRYIFENKFRSTGVTSCSQCPNPPFTYYN